MTGGQGKRHGTFYDFLAYEDMTCGGSGLRMYGESIIKETTETLLERGNRLLYAAKDRSVLQHFA